MAAFNEGTQNLKENAVEDHYSVLRAAFRIAPEIIFAKNADLVYIAASEWFAKSVGKSCVEDVIGKTDFELYERGAAQKHREEDQWILLNKKNIENIVEQFHESDGNIRYDSISKYFLTDEVGNPLGVYGVQQDVTQDVLAKQQYEQEVQYLFETNTNVYATYLLDVDAWKVVNGKESFERKIEYTGTMGIDMFCAKAMEGVYSMEGEAYDFYRGFSPENVKLIYQAGRRDIQMEYRRVLADGEVRWVQDDIKFMKNPENGHLYLAFIISDIELKKRREQELIRRAETDGLTGLLNREAFQIKVQRTLKVEEVDSRHALFMLDVDNFKKLNDTHGHQVGDRFLIEMSTAIKSCFRNTDIIGRLGGDKFLVLMRNTPDVGITRKNAEELMRNINSVCSFYDMTDLSVSIGISMYPADGKSFEELYDQADRALYNAKRQGKGKYEFASGE